MKSFFAVLGIIGAGLLGYWLEPYMRYSLTGVAPWVVPAKPVGKAVPLALPAPVPVVVPPQASTSLPPPDQIPEPTSPETLLPLENLDPVPQPESTPPSTPPGTPLSAAEIVKLMEESVGSGQIQEFTVDDVTEWLAKEDEEIDGVNYQTGLANYESKTIFGVKNYQAKALIKDGKVVRWLGVTTGLEIK